MRILLTAKLRYGIWLIQEPNIQKKLFKIFIGKHVIENSEDFTVPKKKASENSITLFSHKYYFFFILSLLKGNFNRACFFEYNITY